MKLYVFKYNEEENYLDSILQYGYDDFQDFIQLDGKNHDVTNLDNVKEVFKYNIEKNEGYIVQIDIKPNGRVIIDKLIEGKCKKSAKKHTKFLEKLASLSEKENV